MYNSSQPTSAGFKLLQYYHGQPAEQVLASKIINEQTIIVTTQLKYDPPSLLDLNLPLVTPDTPPRATIIESTTSTIAIIMAPLWTWTMPQQHL
uniref:Uncharacterized protein n=1 Tax=Romanomermis culicivorax TaxID=13658 RepID=A0A915IDB6_ROMCU